MTERIEDIQTALDTLNELGHPGALPVHVLEEADLITRVFKRDQLVPFAHDPSNIADWVSAEEQPGWVIPVAAAAAASSALQHPVDVLLLADARFATRRSVYNTWGENQKGLLIPSRRLIPLKEGRDLRLPQISATLSHYIQKAYNLND